MRSQIGPQQDPLVKLLLDTCVVCDADSNNPSNPRLYWDEYRLNLHIPLALEIVEAWKEQLSAYEFVCPVGKSGLTLGVLSARALSMPMIWIDSDGRVIPQSRDIAKKRVAVIDSHSFMGAHFSLAYSRLVARKARKVGFFAIIVRDVEIEGEVSNRLKLPTPPNCLVSSQRDLGLIKSKFEECLKCSLTEAETLRILSGPSFWGRQD